MNHLNIKTKCVEHFILLDGTSNTLSIHSPYPIQKMHQVIFHQRKYCMIVGYTSLAIAKQRTNM